MSVEDIALHKDDDFIDSDTAAKLLGINKNNLRQIVYRKKLVSYGRQKRKSLFLIADVMTLKTHRTKSSVGQGL